MKIDSAFVGMDSARSYASVAQSTTRSAYLTVSGIAQGREETQQSFSDFLDRSAREAKEEAAADTEKTIGERTVFQTSTSERTTLLREQQALEQIRQACILILIRWLYGSLREQRGQEGSAIRFSEGARRDVASDVRNYRYTQQESFFAEREDTSFSSQGRVITSDGRQIDFSLDLSMSRRFVEYTGLTTLSREVAMTDPLVLNLDLPVDTLPDQHFSFDIDCDGNQEEIRSLSPGSGFLALDQNGDGRITDGSELFGTRSGDGFSDLSRYDEDGNGWIDENDGVFDKLVIWTGGPGEGSMYTLKSAGVGAICLQKAATDFTLRDGASGDITGQIRSTGIFLYENGGVGTVQQIDMAG